MKLFKAGDKLVGKSKGGYDITSDNNPLGKKNVYFVADKIEYHSGNYELKLWSDNSFWGCNLEDISLYEEPKKVYNEWYRLVENHNYIAFCHNNGKYGFNEKGEWFDNNNKAILDSKWELADNSVVKEKLIRYAKEKYPVGTKYISAYDSLCEGTVRDTNYCYDITTVFNNSAMGAGTVWKKGKWAKIISKSQFKTIPEYVELLPEFDKRHTGEIFYTKNDVPNYAGWDSNWTWYSILNNEMQKEYFKPSTKEAYDAQNKPKSIEKWSVGSYVVCIKKHGPYFKIGNVAKLDNEPYKIDENSVNLSKWAGKPCYPGKDCCEWFATLQEAEEFSKSFIDKFSNNFESTKINSSGLYEKIIRNNSFEISINQEEFSIDYSEKILNTNTFNLKINYDE